MRLDPHLLPIYSSSEVYDSSDELSWTKRNMEGGILQWDDPSMDSRQVRAREKKIYEHIECLLDAPLSTWGQEDIATKLESVLEFLYVASPAIIVDHTTERLPTNKIRHVVLPACNSLGTSLGYMKGPQGEEIIYPRIFKYETQDHHVILTRKVKHVRIYGEDETALKQQFARDVKNTINNKYDARMRLHSLYTLLPDSHLGTSTSSDHLYATWVYWMLHHGTEQDVTQARICSWMMDGTQEHFTVDGLRLAVQNTALCPPTKIDIKDTLEIDPS